MTMVGRTYRWDGRVWRVIARWRTPGAQDPWTFVAPCCGHVAVIPYGVTASQAYFVLGDKTLGDESYCGACGEMWRSEQRPAGHVCLNGWQPGGRPVVRNVLIEDVATGQRVCRPFRGLRKVTA